MRKVGVEKVVQVKNDNAHKPPSGKNKDVRTTYRGDGCFICNGLHRARDFLNKVSLHVMVAQEGGCQDKDVCMRLMQIVM